MVKSAVFNSSPWIFLSKIGVIDSTLNLFHPVYIPSSVSKEILGKQDESATLLEGLQTKKRIIILEAGNRRLVNALVHDGINIMTLNMAPQRTQRAQRNNG